MGPIEIQTPEDMLERWAGIQCSCDPDVGHLCECCHDTQVVRQLLIDRDSARDCMHEQTQIIRSKNAELEAMQVIENLMLKKSIAALQRIAMLADTGTDEHREVFGDFPTGRPSGWMVANEMRNIANDVVGNMPLEKSR